MTAKNKSTGWSPIREQLKEWPQPALRTLIKDLYDASRANRELLHARLQAEETGSPALEAYRRRIIEQFFPRHKLGVGHDACPLFKFSAVCAMQESGDQSLCGGPNPKPDPIVPAPQGDGAIISRNPG